MHRAAHTLIELLVVVALLGIISLPLYFSYARAQENQGLKVSTEQLADILRTAHVFSREARDLSAWSVRSESDLRSYSLYYSRASGSRIYKTYTLERGTQFPSSFVQLFDVGSGETATPSSILLRNSFGRTMKIDISGTGVIETFFEDVR
jgi:type II secretory pathway pseudopilin PulG